MINSTANKQVRRVTNLVKKARARREEGLYVVEGLRMCRELSPEQVEILYVSESFLKEEEHRKLTEGFVWETVADPVMKVMADTQTPQGILALVRRRDWTLEEILGQPQTPLLMVLETVQDPGNLGTILRAGEGAGITGLIMNTGTADIYNPKVIRSTMGAVFRLPFLYVDDLPGAIGELKSAGVCVYAAHLDGKNVYDKEDYRTGCAFLIGNEGNGLRDEVTACADILVRIPMEGKAESLNAAVAAAVLMFEAGRQRRG